MEYRKLGNSGLKVSALSFGSWVTFSNQVDAKLAQQMFGICLDHGVNFFDNAETYAHEQSEIVMGEALNALSHPRDSYCVSSKVFFGAKENPLPTQMGLSKKHIIEACDQAMKRLKVDYLDLFFCHRADPDTPIGETVWAMHNLVTQGKIIYWGTSEWEESQIREAYEFAEKYNLTPPTMEQPQYNLLYTNRLEKDYLPIFNDYKMGTTIWSPLAAGLLSGKYIEGVPADSRANLPGYEWLRKIMIETDNSKDRMQKIIDLKVIADELGVSLARMSIAWCLLNQNVSTVILGASKISQLEDNLGSMEVLKLLTPEVEKRIRAIID